MRDQDDTTTGGVGIFSRDMCLVCEGGGSDVLVVVGCTLCV